MKDLDFDELDQAVSSVLGSGQAEEKAPATPPVATPEPAKEVVSAPSVAAPTPAPSAPSVSPATKRRGQFLDMVHPSADMTTRSAAAPTARKKISPVSHDIAPPPTAAEVTETQAAVAAAELAPVEEPETPVSSVVTPPVSSETAPTPVEETTPATSSNVAWPDPLDLTPPVTPSEPDTTPSAVPAPVTAEEVPAAPTEAPISSASTTPFVADAKVEKRPLGAFGSEEAPTSSNNTEPTETPPADTPSSEPLSTTSPDPTLMDEQKVPNITPPELQPDVVSVEAAANREFAPEESPEPTPAVDTKSNSGLSQSIPQQYRTPTESPDQTPHPVFDTNEYHQALLPSPHKKKSRGWLVVVVIVILLIVGAALGYFAFMAGL